MIKIHVVKKRLLLFSPYFLFFDTFFTLLVKQTFKNLQQTVFDLGDTNNIHASIDHLLNLGARVIFIRTKEKDLASRVLFVAAQAGHLNETVWITQVQVKQQLLSLVQLYNAIILERQSNVSSIPIRFDHAVQKLAWTTDNVVLFNYTASFRGGLFTFEEQWDLQGYPPFDTFLQKADVT